jgi:hypothetical protein
MSTDQSRVEQDRKVILDAKERGPLATLGAYIKLSGPGWLQSAITLGGGSLGSSLFLGVLGGFALLWLQPLAMILGVIMLSAIAYVTLSTGEKPFQAINKHINPVLGWGWAIATLMANMVWCLPQFSLGTAAVRQNLLPGLLAPEVVAHQWLANLVVCVPIALFCIAMVWSYSSGGTGVKVFNIILKIMVAVIVICFFGVVVKMSAVGHLQWSKIFAGLVPDLDLLKSPAKTFDPFLAESEFRKFWEGFIVGQQRNVMISAAATAVGINMTFLLPYSMLKRGWDRGFRGLAIFDLSTGLFVPFILATGCVVIAAAAQFHTRYAPGLLGEPNDKGEIVQPSAAIAGRYQGVAKKRVAHELGAEAFDALSAEEVAAKVEALPRADKVLAAMLVKRDAFSLADSLAPLTGGGFAHYVFGFGVVGMAVSSIIILMVINGFTICEMFGKESTGGWYRAGSMIPLVGVLGPFFWTKAKFWLVVPTSVFGFTLIPVAYVTFFMMMNSKSLLGDKMPTGGRRVLWNILMGIAVLIMGSAAVWTAWGKTMTVGGTVIPFGRILLLAFVGLAVIVHCVRAAKARQA